MFRPGNTLPAGWEWKALNGLVLVDKEMLASNTSPDYEFWYIDISSVKTGKISFPSVKTRFRNSPSRARKRVRFGDVLMSTVRPNLQAFCAFNEAGDDYVASTGFAVLTPLTGTSSGFIYHSLLSDYVGRQIEDNTTGSNYPAIPSSSIPNLSIATPPREEQYRIASVLDTVDQAIKLTEEVIQKLKRIKVGFLNDLLTHGLDENGELRDPIHHPEQFKDSPIGRIPMDWEVMPIDDIASHVGSGITPTGGSNIYTSEGVLFIRSQNVTFEGLLLDDVVYIPARIHYRMKRSEIFENDVLLNITGASLGRCCVFSGLRIIANVNQHVCAIRLKDQNPGRSIFLSDYLASFWGQNQIFRSNAGSNREGLNYEQIRSIKVPWPKSSQEAETIADILGGTSSQVAKERQILSKLLLLKKGLMQDLLTGQVPIPKELFSKDGESHAA